MVLQEWLSLDGYATDKDGSTAFLGSVTLTENSDQEVIADKLNSAQKVVFSKTLKNAPWEEWTAATVISTDAIAVIRKLKAEEGSISSSG